MPFLTLPEKEIARDSVISIPVMGYLSEWASRGSERILPEAAANVFRDLGLADADVLQAKADLIFRISAIIEKRGLTQVEAAQILGVSQPKISALLRGHLDGFSLERIMRFLAALDQKVEIKVRPKSRRDRAVAVA